MSGEHRSQVASWIALMYLVAGIALLASSLSPMDALQTRLMGDWSGSYLGMVLAALPGRLRTTGLILLGAGVLTWIARRHLGYFLAEVASGIWSLKLDIRNAFGLFIADRGGLVVLGALTLLGALVRVTYLDLPIRYDEAFSYNEFAARPLFIGLSYYANPNNHLFHTFLVHLVTAVLGSAPWAIRLPAFVAGTLLIPATYSLGAPLYGRHAGLLAAGLAAVSAPLIEYSINARGYTLQILLVLMTLNLCVYARRRDNAAALLLAAGTMTLGAYTMPTMLYAFGLVLAWLTLSWRGSTRGVSKSWLVGFALLTSLGTLALYVPVLLVSGVESITANRFVRPLPLAILPGQAIGSAATAWEDWNTGLPSVVSAVLVIGLIVGLVRHGQVAKAGPPMLVAAAIGCLPIALAQRVVPFERVWLFLLPLYFLMAASGVVAVSTWLGWPRDGSSRSLKALAGGTWILVATWLASGLVQAGGIGRAPETGLFEEAEAVTRFIRDSRGATIPVRTAHPTSLPQLQYYFPRYGLRADQLVQPLEQQDRVIVIVPTRSGEHSTNDLVARAELNHEVWLSSLQLTTIGQVTIYELIGGAA